MPKPSIQPANQQECARTGEITSCVQGERLCVKIGDSTALFLTQEECRNLILHLSVHADQLWGNMIPELVYYLETIRCERR